VPGDKPFFGKGAGDAKNLLFFFPLITHPPAHPKGVGVAMKSFGRILREIAPPQPAAGQHKGDDVAPLPGALSEYDTDTFRVGHPLPVWVKAVDADFAAGGGKIPAALWIMEDMPAPLRPTQAAHPPASIERSTSPISSKETFGIN
jgi:hypothetical protein